jgi:uncharacterized membrane protein YbhN (UPF0104 family)
LSPSFAELQARDFLHWKPSPGALALSLAMLLVFYIAHAFLWRRIMRDLGIGRPDARTTIRIYFVAGLGKYLPGKFWALAGFAVLSREAGLSAASATAAALIGQFGFLATGLLLLALLLPEWGGGMPAMLGGGALAIAAAVLWILVATPLGHGARERIRKVAGNRLGTRLGNAFELAERIRPRAALLWLAGYGFSWILLGMAFTVFCAAFVPGAASAPRPLAGALAASYLAGYVALVPAGLGVREAALATLLASVAQVPVAAAVVIAIASRVWFSLAELLPLASLPLLRRKEQ